MRYQYESEADYARDLCREYEPALEHIQKDLFGKLLYIANGFINPRMSERHDAKKSRTSKTYAGDPLGGYEYVDPNTKYAYTITPEITETIHWMAKKIAPLSCKYKGLNKSTLNTYIISCLGSKKYGFNDFLKWKHGNSYNIPKAIKALPNIYKNIFIDLCRKVPSEKIAYKQGIDESECIAIINEIRKVLHQKNLISRIDSPIHINIFKKSDNEEDEFEEFISNDDIDIDVLNDIDVISDTLRANIKSIDKAESRLLLLKYGLGESSRDIYDTFFTNSDDNIFNKLNITTEKSINAIVEKIIVKISELIKQNSMAVYEDYNLFDRGILKKAMRVYFSNIIEKN